MSARLDIGRLRADTAGSGHVAHLNNAGAALPPAAVTEAVVGFLRLEERMGGYEAYASRADDVAAVYGSIATLVGCRPDQVALVESATEGWSRAFQAVAFTRPLGPGDRVLVSSAEYASNVLPVMQVAARSGVRLEFIPDDEHGCVDVDALARTLDDDVALVAITHCPSQNGLVNDVAAIGAELRGHPAWYLVDACQSAGQLPVDVRSIGADFLSATGRKWLRGPRGTGFLYASDRALDGLEPFPVDMLSATWTDSGYELRPGARRYEYFEKSYACILGLGAAVDYALGCGIDALAGRIGGLAARARTGLASVDGVRVHDRGQGRSGIVTFTRDGAAAASLVRALAARGINVSLASTATARHDFEARGLDGMVRASPHAYNTEDEVDALVEAVAATRPDLP